LTRARLCGFSAP